MAVLEIELRGRKLAHHGWRTRGTGEEHARRPQGVAGAGAMRSGVAHDGAADGAGDARAPLQPGQAPLRQVVHELGQTDAGARVQDGVLAVHLVQPPRVNRHARDDAARAGVGIEHVGSVADQHQRPRMLPGEGDEGEQVVFAPDADPSVRRPTHRKGAVARQRLVPAHEAAEARLKPGEQVVDIGRNGHSRSLDVR